VLYAAAKRLLDFSIAAALVVFLLPLFAAIALAIRIGMGAPVLFAQERPGLDGRIFTLYKFRSMAKGEITALGRLLRRWSLDELPQLFNVLRGDLSLVGPRPLLPEYMPLYTAAQARRHEVKPGITGWAQVQGRNAISWDEKLALDIWYVEHRSLLLDLRILAATAVSVLAGSGLEGPGSERFTGGTR
jgi:lipopolysaccharide/colanic/teichoic acid biosynthesis glycosyltransferase